MNEQTIPQELLQFIKSVASESRLKILLLFMGAPALTVNQIAATVGLGQSTTSEHLKIMRRSGLLISNKQGKEVYYQPDRARIIHQLESLGDILKNCCEL